jgi:TP901 family phage tail tape measure protein
MIVGRLTAILDLNSSSFDAGMARASSSLNSAGKKLSGFGRSATMFVTLPLLALGAKAIKTAADFEESMNAMGAVAGVPGPQLDKLRKLAIKLGADTAFSANEAAAAMLELSKAGVSTSNIMGGGLKNTLDLATAGNIDLAQAATITSNAMNIFGLSGKRSKEAVDALAGAANASSADVDDLALALQMGGNAAAAAGLTIQETTGVLAMLADQGIRGSDAGTSLKTMLLNLVPTSVKAKETMRELGVNFVNANGEIKSMSEVANVLQSRLGGLTQAQQQAALKVMFGTDAYRAARIVMDSGAEGLSKYIKATSESGTAAEVAAARMKGLPGALEHLRGAAETALLTLGNRLAPTLMKVGDVIQTVLEGFVSLPKPMQEMVVAVMAIVAAIGPFAWVAGQAMQSVKRLGTAFSALTSPTGLATAAVAGLAFGIYNLITAENRATAASRGLIEGLTDIGAMTDLRSQFESTARAASNLGTQMSDALEEFIGKGPSATNELHGLQQAIFEARREAEQMDGATRKIAEAQASYAQAVLHQTEALAAFGAGSQEAAFFTERLDAAEKRLAAALRLSGQATAEVEMSTESLADTRRRLAGITDTVRSAELNLRDAQRTLADAQRELNRLKDEGVTSGRKYQEALDAVERAQINVRESQRSLAVSTKDLADNLAAATVKGRVNKNAFLELAETWGLNRKKVNELTGDVPNAAEALQKLGREAGLSKKQSDILAGALESLKASAIRGSLGAKTAVQGIPGHVRSQVGPTRSAAISLGNAISQGVIAGIQPGDVVNAVAGMMSQVIAAARQQVDAHSPSRVFEKIGKDIVAGLMRGLNKTEHFLDRFTSQIDNAIDKLKNKLEKQIDGLTSKLEKALENDKLSDAAIASLKNATKKQIEALKEHAKEQIQAMKELARRFETEGRALLRRGEALQTRFDALNERIANFRDEVSGGFSGMRDLVSAFNDEADTAADKLRAAEEAAVAAAQAVADARTASDDAVTALNAAYSDPERTEETVAAAETAQKAAIAQLAAAIAQEDQAKAALATTMQESKATSVLRNLLPSLQSRAKHFADVLDRLAAAGLGEELIRQIAAAGEEALPMAEALLEDASGQLIIMANQTAKTINDTVERISDRLTDLFFGQEMAAVTREMAEFAREVERFVDHMAREAEKLNFDALANALRGFAENISGIAGDFRDRLNAVIAGIHTAASSVVTTSAPSGGSMGSQAEQAAAAAAAAAQGGGTKSSKVIATGDTFNIQTVELSNIKGARQAEEFFDTIRQVAKQGAR